LPCVGKAKRRAQHTAPRATPTETAVLKLPRVDALVLEEQLDAELLGERVVTRERHAADVVRESRRRVEHRQQRRPRPQAARRARQPIGKLAAHGVEVVLDDHGFAGRRAARAQADRPREAVVRHLRARERADQAGNVRVDAQRH
jgi:hypothetical protein